MLLEQEVVSSAEAGKEVMIVSRDHGPVSARPVVFITALESNSSVTLASGKGADTDSYNPTSVLTFSQIGEKRRATLPVSGDMTDQVSVVRVNTGHVRIAVVSPAPIQTEFRTRKHP